MPLLALILVFIVFPIAELYVILKVGDAIGIGWTLLLLVADSLLGSMLLRSQGRTVWRRFNATLAEGRMPHREVMDGVLVIFGGAFLITPGFITDIFGVLLLLPPTRAVIRRLVARTARAPGGGRRGRLPPGPRLRRGGHARASTTCRPGGSSVERARARRRLLRPRPRALRERALGCDRAVRGAQARGPCPRGPRWRPWPAAGRPSCRDGSTLEFEPVAPEADLGGVSATVCMVRGEAAGTRVEGLGTVAETPRLPAWDELDALRTHLRPGGRGARPRRAGAAAARRAPATTRRT